jgi:hypothetical protein
MPYDVQNPSRLPLEYNPHSQIQMDKSNLNTYLELFSDAEINSANIWKVIGPMGLEDIFFRVGNRFGCYEGRTRNYLFVGDGLTEDQAIAIYGGGRNLPKLKDWFYDEKEVEVDIASDWN